jgi:hypothetical protein
MRQNVEKMKKIFPPKSKFAANFFPQPFAFNDQKCLNS